MKLTKRYQNNYNILIKESYKLKKSYETKCVHVNIYCRNDKNNNDTSEKSKK